MIIPSIDIKSELAALAVSIVAATTTSITLIDILYFTALPALKDNAGPRSTPGADLLFSAFTPVVVAISLGEIHLDIVWIGITYHTD
jgi:hypothetical protein